MNNPPTLHVAALPHLATVRDNSFCAYTSKILRFCNYMPTIGWNVIHYGGEESTVPCEHVTIITKKERDQWYGTYPREATVAVKYDAETPLFRRTNARAASAILDRANKGDLFLTLGGTSQMPIAQQIGALAKIDERTKRPIPTEMTTVEFGVGYYGIFSQCHVYDSYSHQSMLSGQTGQHASMNFFDAVIPMGYDIVDFPMGNGNGVEGVFNKSGLPVGRDGYLLYVGRLTKGKGLEIAIATAKACGISLLIAGQGIVRPHPTAIITAELQVDDPDVHYIGVLDPDERAKIMGGAMALFCPSLYNEPGGQVVQEAQVCGTPVISTDWGGMVENIEHGLSGFRCRSIREFIAAVKECPALDRQSIRDRAIRMWSQDRIKWMYDAYLKRVASGVNDFGMNRTDLPADLLALNQHHEWTEKKTPTLRLPEIKPSNGNGNHLLVQT